MSRWRLTVGIVTTGLLLTLAGCGESGPKKYPVSGTVTFDGQELPEGDIIFFPESKAVGPEATKIKDGKYSLKVHQGNNRVEIRATRPVPGKKGPMGEQAIEDYIPDKFNNKSTLAADVGEGKVEHNFDLKK